MVEFIHTATLLHDDVVDESELRRGRATASALFGNAASVLVGDFLYSRAFQMMVEVDDMRVMQTLADATNVIAEGEVLQLLNCHDANVDAANYLHVIHCKTAKLFEAAMRLGAILAKAYAADGTGCGEIRHASGHRVPAGGRCAGLFRPTRQETGKNLGDDLAEGKPTLPLIYAMQHGAASRPRWCARPSNRATWHALPKCCKSSTQTGALEYTRSRRCARRKWRVLALSVLPDSNYNQSLLQLAHFAATRQF